MKIRGLLAALLVAVALGGCTGSVTAPEAPRTNAVAAPALDESPPPPPPDSTDTQSRTGGAMGTGT